MMIRLNVFLVFLLCVSPVGLNAQDKEPAAKSQDVAEEKSKESDSKPDSAQTIETIKDLIDSGKLKEAAAAIDDAVESEPNNRRVSALRMTLASAAARKRDYKLTATQYQKVIESRLAREKTSSTELVSLVGIANSYFGRTGRYDEVLPLIDRIEVRIKKTTSLTEVSPGLRDLLRLHNTRRSILMRTGKLSEGNQILRDDTAAMRKLLANAGDDDKPVATEMLALSMSHLFQTMTVGEDRTEMFNEHQKLLKELIDDGETKLAVDYVSAGTLQLGRIYRNDAGEAKTLLDDLTQTIEKHQDHKRYGRQLTSMKRNLSRYESRINSSLKIQESYGKPAPAFDKDVAWVGVEKPLNLKGKVVLLDFWAVWCGPCIATFPHLKHLTDEYGDKGLQIVGVTRYYGYKWDEDRKTAVRERGSKDTDAEHEALEQFLAKYKLEHPTIVVPEDSTFHKSHFVTGIPHAALIDQDGNIQMVQIGSGPSSAKNVEAKIRELLKLDTE